MECPRLQGSGLSWPKLRARIAESSREELRTMPIIQQTWAQSQAIAGRMQTHGVTPTRPSWSAAVSTRSPDRASAACPRSGPGDHVVRYVARPPLAGDVPFRAMSSPSLRRRVGGRRCHDY